jgi:trafficking protein particle complex subunit 10
VAILTSRLREAGLETYIHWLQPVLVSQLRGRSGADLETAGLLGEVRLGRYEDYGWDEALEGVNPTNGDRERVESQIREFYEVRFIFSINRCHTNGLKEKSNNSTKFSSKPNNT